MKERPRQKIQVYRGPRVVRPPSEKFNEFSQIARAEKSPVASMGAVLPETSSPVQQVSRIFDIQSYFDNVLLERALSSQNRNSPIVEGTVREEQIPGYAIGLHPSSQTPVAVQFKIGGQPTSSQAITLVPGQIVRPHGLPRGMDHAHFSGFYWGLPFGWLGGGLATLLVFQTSDADAAWNGRSEVLFHRQRMQIVDAAAATDVAARYNWPLRFPWTQAIRGTDNIGQQGMAAISIGEPTRVVMSLQLGTLAAPATMRMVYWGTNDFHTDANGDVVITSSIFDEVVWPSYSAATGTGRFAAQFPFIQPDDKFVRMAADDGGVLLTSTDAALIGQYVDVDRYGKIG